MRSCQQGQEEPLLIFGEAFPIQSVSVCSLRLVNSRGRKDDKRETQQQLAKPTVLGQGAVVSHSRTHLSLKPFLTQPLPSLYLLSSPVLNTLAATAFCPCTYSVCPSLPPTPPPGGCCFSVVSIGFIPKELFVGARRALATSARFGLACVEERKEKKKPRQERAGPFPGGWELPGGWQRGRSTAGLDAGTALRPQTQHRPPPRSTCFLHLWSFSCLREPSPAFT